MRNTLAFSWTPLVTVLTTTTVPQAVAQKQAQVLRDNSEFRALQNPVISSDGAWMAAEESRDRGDGSVRVWSTTGDAKFTIERGQRPRISRDSRWVSALQKPPLEDSGTATSKNKRAGQTLVLLDLQEGSRRTFDFVMSYDVTYTSSYLLYLQSPEAEADEERASKEETAKPTAHKRAAGTLHMVHLKDGMGFTIEHVAQYVAHLTHANHGTNDHFAYVVHDEETGRDTLHMAVLNPGRDLRGNWGTRGIHASDKIEGLCWSHDNAMAVFLDNKETTGKDGNRRVSSALYTWHDVPGRSGQGKFTRVDRGDSEFAALHNPVISADGAWVAAHEGSGDENVRVWSTQGDAEFTIEHGQRARFSRDSRWVSALQKPLLEDSRTANSKNRRAGQTLVLLDLQDGSRRAFDFVLSYDMTYDSTYLLYLQLPETKADEEVPSKEKATKSATEPATKERKTGTLHQIPLNSARLSRIMRPYVPNQVFTKENVVEFTVHPTNDHFAYVFHDAETGGETLHVVKWGIRAWYNGEKIDGLGWAAGADGGDESIILGFLNSTETNGEDGRRRVNSAFYTWRPAHSNNGKFTRVDTHQ